MAVITISSTFDDLKKERTKMGTNVCKEHNKTHKNCEGCVSEEQCLALIELVESTLFDDTDE